MCSALSMAFFLFSFLLIKAAAAAQSYISYQSLSADKPYISHQNLSWSVRDTEHDHTTLGNGRSYNFLLTSNSSSYRFGFLSDENEEVAQLSIVAWDSVISDIADIIWQVDKKARNAILLVQNNGSLVLLDEKNESVWSINTSITADTIWLTDYGALELRDSGNRTTWSSFLSPTNKLVCGQVLQQGMKLKNEEYALNVDETAAVLRYQGHPYHIWRNVNASNFLAFCCCNINYTATATLGLRSDMASFSKNRSYLEKDLQCKEFDVPSMLTLSLPIDHEYVAVATLGSDGIITATKLLGHASAFQGNEYCDLPNVCGQYGICNIYSPYHSCSCPLNSSYFIYKDGSDTTSGCHFATTYALNGRCQILNQSGIDYYETEFVNPDITVPTKENCSMACFTNSTCAVAFYQQPTNSCFLMNNISSLKHANASYIAFFKLCKPFSPPNSGDPSKYNTAVITATSIAAFCFVLFVVAVTVYWKVKRMQKEEDEDEILTSFLSETTLKRFSIRELEEITSSFGEKIGMGAFGTVYKGVLPNKNFVAVKRLNGSTQEAKDFYAEVSVLSRVRHFNLVQLLGFCSKMSKRTLVYEYLANGSLDQWLLGKKQPFLSWGTRMEIAIGSAKGMAYLHEECAEKILHLDVKPQNILLDENFCPKVADFGLSQLIDRDENNFFMTTICGTPGYLAPEMITGEAGVKSDVYSFGVVLLEILTGSRPIEPKGEDFWDYSSYDNVVSTLVDGKLEGSFNLVEAKRILKVAALCINYEPQLRPSMSSVVQMLEGNIDIPQFVNAPQFFPKLNPEVSARLMKLLEYRMSTSSYSMTMDRKCQ